MIVKSCLDFRINFDSTKKLFLINAFVTPTLSRLHVVCPKCRGSFINLSSKPGPKQCKKFSHFPGYFAQH